MEGLQVDGLFERRSDGDTPLLVVVDDLLSDDGEICG
jgi:hypothetical protein